MHKKLGGQQPRELAPADQRDTTSYLAIAIGGREGRMGWRRGCSEFFQSSGICLQNSCEAALLSWK